MKILKLTTVALLSLSLIATSCKKEEKIEEAVNNTTTPVENTDDTFSLKLNGTTFNTSSFHIQEQFGDIMINTLNMGNGSTNVGIVIKTSLSAGTYSFDTDNFGRVDLNNNNQPTSTVSYNTGGSGSITITEHNTTNKFIKGTFNFVATDMSGNNSQTVTNGAFQANY